MSRRSFVAGGIAGLGAIATGLGGARPAVAQAPAAGTGKPQRIDVHHHAAADLRAIERGNALALLPRLRD